MASDCEWQPYLHLYPIHILAYAFAVPILYLSCRWVANLKSRRGDESLSYI